MEDRIHSKYTIFKWDKNRDNRDCLTPIDTADSAPELLAKLQLNIDRQIIKRSEIIVNWPPIEGITVSPAPDFYVTLPTDLV